MNGDGVVDKKDPALRDMIGKSNEEIEQITHDTDGRIESITFKNGEEIDYSCQENSGILKSAS